MSSYLRKMLADHAELVVQAQQIMDKAEAEERELTEDERKAYVELLGEGETDGKVGELDQKIKTEIADREKLRQAAEKKFALPGEQAVKPEAGDPKRMKRAEYDKLTLGQQAAFIRAGGKVED